MSPAKKKTPPSRSKRKPPGSQKKKTVKKKKTTAKKTAADTSAEPTAENTDESAIVEIKKYSNRRLYDTSSSRYVTLGELGDMIRKGTNIRVYDARSGQDLTRTVMLQIILENEQDMKVLPVSFLRKIIEASSEAVADSFRVTLSSTMEVLSRMHEEFQSQMKEMTSIGAVFPPLTLQWMTFMSRYFQNVANLAEPSSSSRSNPKDRESE